MSFRIISRAVWATESAMRQRFFTKHKSDKPLRWETRYHVREKSKPKEVRQEALLVDALARWFSLFEHLGH